MFKRFFEWLKNRKIVSKPRAGNILNKEEAVEICIDVTPRGLQGKVFILSCYFHGFKPNDLMLKEIKRRIEVFCQELLDNFLPLLYQPYILDWNHLIACQFIFVPNRFKCKYHSTWCGGVYEWIFRNSPDKKTQNVPGQKHTMIN